MSDGWIFCSLFRYFDLHNWIAGLKTVDNTETPSLTTPTFRLKGTITNVPICANAIRCYFKLSSSVNCSEKQASSL